MGWLADTWARLLGQKTEVEQTQAVIKVPVDPNRYPNSQEVDSMSMHGAGGGCGGFILMVSIDDPAEVIKWFTEARRAAPETGPSRQVHWSHENSKLKVTPRSDIEDVDARLAPSHTAPTAGELSPDIKTIILYNWYTGSP